jgi:hypothetical protein
MNYSKIPPLKVEDFPPSLRDQVLKFNKLLMQDEFHRSADLTTEEELKFIHARQHLLKARAKLMESALQHKKQDFWKSVAKLVLQVGASLVFLIYQLITNDVGPFAIAMIVLGLVFAVLLILHWIW